jgi:hypothetical protein
LPDARSQQQVASGLTPETRHLKPLFLWDMTLVSQPPFFFYLLMQLGKVLRGLVFKAAAYGYYTCGALNSAYTTSDAPIRIYLRFIFNHFYSIYRANIGAGTAADAFLQLGFTDEIDGH